MLQKGMRVAVPFGKSKIYTGLVFSVHQDMPTLYEAKEIYQILDDSPIVNEFQLELWRWVSDYYMCPLGEVYRASFPSAFLLQSETIILKNITFTDESILTDSEFLVFEALQYKSQLTIQEIANILGKKKVMPSVNKLINKGAIYIEEKIYERYKPKLVKYVRLREEFKSDNSLKKLLLQFSKRAEKQREAILTFFQISLTKKPVKAKDIEKKANISSYVLKSLVNKNILEFYYLQTDRVNFEGVTNKLKKLDEFQEQALSEIKESFTKKDVTLLYGVASSGKTEIYSKLIEEALNSEKQVLFLLPENALTTQIIVRLQYYFGNKISVYHPRYSMNERVEVWNNVLENNTKAQIILGTRTSIFLPFSNLGLIIVDQEHENYYKSFETYHRYNARETSIVLAKIHKAKVLLGSATPSIESYFNSRKGKYGLVKLSNRFGKLKLPKIELIDIREKRLKNKMRGHFSDRMLELIKDALSKKKQVILFQNRRGFSPVVVCKVCSHIPQCTNCDVSLTYHKFKHKLCCHYCNFQRVMPNKCDACGSSEINTRGFGTEQIEIELKNIFSDYKIGRLDLDTVRGKYEYQKITYVFQSREIDIIVGTKMLTKGLCFENVYLVGIMNADSLLNFPYFRSHEVAYQTMAQIFGSASRSKEQGKVAIQTNNPNHQILKQVSTSNYEEMYKTELKERKQYNYPPYYRLIKITLKHKDFMRVDMGANWFFKSLYNSFGKNVLGPTSPVVTRVRNQYIKNISIKIPPKQSLVGTKKTIIKIKNTFESIKDFRPIIVIIDVDSD